MLGYSVGYDKLITDTQCTFVPKYTSSQLHKKVLQVMTLIKKAGCEVDLADYLLLALS